MSESNNRKVIFRRIKGRIVPIRMKEGTKESLKAGGLIGTGVGASTAASYYAARLTNDSAHMESIARNYVKTAKAARDTGNIKKFLKFGDYAARSAVKSKVLQKSAFRVRGAGAALGTAFIGAGIYKALGQTSLKDDPTAKASVSTVAAGISQFSMWNAYLRGVGNRGNFKTSLKTLKMAVRRVVTKGV